MSFFINRFKKCRVDNNVYKDKDEVDNELDDAKKYALYKIIYFIKNEYKNLYDHNIRNTKGIAMDKLKNITNNCNSIIEKWFDLPDYLFKQKVFQQQIYYTLNISNFVFDNFFEFFSYFNLLDAEKYIKEDDDEAIIFKLSCLNGAIYIRLSKKDLKNPQSNNDKIKIYKIYQTLDSNDSLYGYMLMDEKNFEIYAGSNGSRTEQKLTGYTFDKISINNQQLANDFNKQQGGGIGKKTIKTKSKPFKNTILQKKEILGKDMRIYKINGSKKEYVKYKGNLISVSDYKKIIKLKKLNNFLLY